MSIQPETSNTGAEGELIAEDFLKEKGFKIIERNLHLSGGELDIIALHERALVFIEVKTRHGTSHGNPAEAITSHKAKRLARASMAYLTGCSIDYSSCRCDVISVLFLSSNDPEIEHFEDCIDLEGALHNRRWRQ